MASFWFSFALTISFMASPLLSLASQLNSETPTISASPSFLTNPPLSPLQELSPDIAPLLPSPGGVVPTKGSSIPTIPSSPSPPNPDELIAPGLDSAFPPFESLPASSAAPLNLVGTLKFASFIVGAAYWLLQFLRM